MPDPSPPQEAVEAVAEWLYYFAMEQRKHAGSVHATDGWDRVPDNYKMPYKEGWRDKARAVLDAVDLVPREELERVDARRHELVSKNVAMAEIRNEALRRAETAEAQARSYREALERIASEPGTGWSYKIAREALAAASREAGKGAR